MLECVFSLDSVILTYHISCCSIKKLCARVQAFFPVLDEAKRKLAEAIKEKGRDDYDIQVLESHETNTYVEMLKHQNKMLN
ncbi:hypothetical protein GOP47_0005089 [Adiantum capillus-veneris]|uniref:Uncharacterized protein n=1 Tax=Adiantum capillus-veneris TaxID=13818 RepID=A0A9D4V535_ADICA|nr:hypothetical protein GOP47_0005089 [Adiantum capillus-veneris]